MKTLDLINEHQVIRETVGYDFLKDIELHDVPEVIQFLKVVYNYKKMNQLNKQDKMDNICYKKQKQP